MATQSFLEFGSIDLENSTKKIWDFVSNDKAYDWYMLARYANDMHIYELMKQGNFDRFEEIHHKNDLSLNLRKLLLLKIAEKNTTEASFFEIGQTLFGCIEGIEFCNEYLNQKVNLNAVEWNGVDISDMFNYYAKKMHMNHRVNTYTSYDEMNKISDVFFAKGVTLLYACDNVKSLFKMIRSKMFSSFDYSLYLKENKSFTLGTGYDVSYFSLQAFLEEYKKDSKTIFIKKSTAKVDEEKFFFEAIYTEESLMEQFFDTNNQLEVNDEVTTMFGFEVEEKSNWVELEVYVTEHIQV